VVLRLRGRSRVGATLVEVLDRYADDLAEVGGRLYLSGVHEEVSQQLRHAGKLDLDQTVQLVPETTILGASTERAVEFASAWLGHSPHVR
jgi:sulfate permease, SulP family